MSIINMLVLVFVVNFNVYTYILGVPPNINDERIQALTQLKDSLSKNEPAVLFNVVNELSMVRLKSFILFCLFILYIYYHYMYVCYIL